MRLRKHCLIVLLLGGCAPVQATLPARSAVVGIAPSPSDPLHRAAKACTTTAAAPIKITEAGRYVRLGGLDSTALDCDSVIRDSLLFTGWQADLASGDVIVGGFDNYEGFRYSDARLVLQALSLPLKFRPAVSGQDSLPATVETGFNPAFALGYQYRQNRYTVQKNALGNNVTSLAITGGALVGVSAVGLKSANTSGADIGVERSVPAASVGLFGLMGFDRINIGFALGLDHAFGARSDDWLYQHKPWYGVSVGLDLVK